ncbi:MAG TPA: HNH endonuclease signature motif containing protein [Acidimicrobiia bacterium]|nr:HNH endonuclease signature motif containing protein [Acidimicrobiia bacterium]
MFTDTLDELRTWSTDRLCAARDEAVVEERRWRLRRLAIDRVLDERRGPGGNDAAEWVATQDRVRTQTARTEVDVARGLEALPAIAAAAEAGELSLDQLEHLVVLATPETDAEWAQRGRTAAPTELGRLVRRQRVVSETEMAARREAREFRWWRRGDMLHLRGQLPDVQGVLVESVFEHLIEKMRPAKGASWDTRAHRGADALVQLCQDAQDRTTGATPAAGRTAKAWSPRIVVHLGSDAQPTCNGIPISLGTVQQLIDDGAPVRKVHDDDALAPSRGDAIPAALRDYLVGRDTTCRVPGCERAIGLDAHHLVPRSHGGRTDKHNVCLVCKRHHRRAVPHGPWVLDGDPEQLDGLEWRRIDQSDGGARARDGPAA